MLNQAVQESEKLLDEQDVKKVLEIEERNELEKAKQASIKFQTDAFFETVKNIKVPGTATSAGSVQV